MVITWFCFLFYTIPDSSTHTHCKYLVLTDWATGVTTPTQAEMNVTGICWCFLLGYSQMSGLDCEFISPGNVESDCLTTNNPFSPKMLQSQVQELFKFLVKMREGIRHTSMETPGHAAAQLCKGLCSLVLMAAQELSG